MVSLLQRYMTLKFSAIPKFNIPSFNKLKTLLLILVTFGLVACDSGDKATSTPVADKKEEATKTTLTVWAWDKNFNVPIVQEAANRFTQTHPDVTINVVDFGREDIITKLHAGLLSGSLDTLPDVVLIEDYLARLFIESYQGKFVDLTSSINFADFAPYKVKAVTVDNKSFAVPFDSGVTALFYRKDILQESGFSPADLENITWDRFIEIGKTVKAKTGKDMIGGDLFADTGLLRSIMQSAGSWYFDEAGNITIANNEVLKEAVKVLMALNDAGIVKSTKGWGEWVGSMNNGDVASVVTGAWIIGSLKTATDQTGKWGVMPYPRLAQFDTAKNSSNLGGASWFVINNPRAETSVKFLQETFAKDTDLYGKILVERGAIGTFLPSQKIEAYNTEDPFFDNEKAFQKISTYINQIPSVNYGSYVNEADYALTSVLTDVLNHTITVEAGLQKAEEALKNQIAGQ